jgi:hypothetical protein
MTTTIRIEDSDRRFLRLQADYLNIRDTSELKPMRRIGVDCVESEFRLNVAQAEAKRDRYGSCTAKAALDVIDTVFLPFLGFSWPSATFENE